MLMVFLVFAGICLFINGINLYYMHSNNNEKAILAKDAAIVNIFTGVLGVVVIANIIYHASQTTENYAPAAYIGLFALTYTWSGINAFTGSNGRALGWFSLLVTLIAIPAGLVELSRAHTLIEYWLGISWLAWGVLWFLSFLILVQQKPLSRLTGGLSSFQGITTALLPAILHFWGVI